MSQRDWTPSDAAEAAEAKRYREWWRRGAYDSEFADIEEVDGTTERTGQVPGGKS
jgi:hypothetical protein